MNPENWQLLFEEYPGPKSEYQEWLKKQGFVYTKNNGLVLEWGGRQYRPSVTQMQALQLRWLAKSHAEYVEAKLRSLFPNLPEAQLKDQLSGAVAAMETKGGHFFVGSSGGGTWPEPGSEHERAYNEAREELEREGEARLQADKDRLKEAQAKLEQGGVTKKEQKRLEVEINNLKEKIAKPEKYGPPGWHGQCAEVSCLNQMMDKVESKVQENIGELRKQGQDVSPETEQKIRQEKLRREYKAELSEAVEGKGGSGRGIGDNKPPCASCGKALPKQDIETQLPSGVKKDGDKMQPHLGQEPVPEQRGDTNGSGNQNGNQNQQSKKAPPPATSVQGSDSAPVQDQPSTSVPCSNGQSLPLAACVGDGDAQKNEPKSGSGGRSQPAGSAGGTGGPEPVTQEGHAPQESGGAHTPSAPTRVGAEPGVGGGESRAGGFNIRQFFKPSRISGLARGGFASIAKPDPLSIALEAGQQGYDTFKQWRAVNAFPTPQEFVKQRDEQWERLYGQIGREIGAAHHKDFEDAKYRIHFLTRLAEKREAEKWDRLIDEASGPEKSRLTDQKNAAVQAIRNSEAERVESAGKSLDKLYAEEMQKRQPTERDREAFNKEYKENADRYLNKVYEENKQPILSRGLLAWGSNFLSWEKLQSKHQENLAALDQHPLQFLHAKPENLENALHHSRSHYTGYQSAEDAGLGVQSSYSGKPVAEDGRKRVDEQQSYDVGGTHQPMLDGIGDLAVYLPAGLKPEMRAALSRQQWESIRDMANDQLAGRGNPVFERLSPGVVQKIRDYAQKQADGKGDQENTIPVELAPLKPRNQMPLEAQDNALPPAKDSEGREQTAEQTEAAAKQLHPLPPPSVDDHARQKREVDLAAQPLQVLPQDEAKQHPLSMPSASEPVGGKTESAPAAERPLERQLEDAQAELPKTQDDAAKLGNQGVRPHFDQQDGSNPIPPEAAVAVRKVQDAQTKVDELKRELESQKPAEESTSTQPAATGRLDQQPSPSAAQPDTQQSSATQPTDTVLPKQTPPVERLVTLPQPKDSNRHTDSAGGPTVSAADAKTAQVVQPVGGTSGQDLAALSGLDDKAQGQHADDGKTLAGSDDSGSTHASGAPSDAHWDSRRQQTLGQVQANPGDKPAVPAAPAGAVLGTPPAAEAIPAPTADGAKPGGTSSSSPAVAGGQQGPSVPIGGGGDTVLKELGGFKEASVPGPGVLPASLITGSLASAADKAAESAAALAASLPAASTPVAPSAAPSASAASPLTSSAPEGPSAALAPAGPVPAEAPHQSAPSVGTPAPAPVITPAPYATAENQAAVPPAEAVTPAPVEAPAPVAAVPPPVEPAPAVPPAVEQASVDQVQQ